MIDLLKRIYPLNLAPVSPDTDKAVEILKKELPFIVHEYSSGKEHNGWVVPKSWKVTKARICKDGKVVYDGSKHPLGVMGYSKSFRGKVNLKQLKEHLTFRKDNPSAVGYHCDYYYKPWLADWGISIPYSLFKKLKVGEYSIDIETSYSQGTMKVLDYFLKGESNDIIFFNAHNCHAGQANDDIAGVVIGVELMKQLAKLKKRRYSYRLVIAPEHYGTIFYLANLKEDEANKFKYGFFLEMLGHNNHFSLQRSFTGDTYLDKICEHYLSMHFPDTHFDDFRKIVGNDETVWEAPGYEIPTVSLSRGLYPQYHTSFDNEDIIIEYKLQESVDVLLGIVNILETNCCAKRNFKGLMALSNPKYDLYLRPGTDPSIADQRTETMAQWNYFMDCVVRYFEGNFSILEMSMKHSLPYEDVYNYVSKFKEKKLVTFVANERKLSKGCN
jgi:aminopeptidase-like protein